MSRKHLGTFLAIVLIGMLYSPSGAAAPPDGAVVLRDHWFLQSSERVEDPGETVSLEAYQPKEAWYPVTVPTTVLAALVDNKVYPDPFYGLNLTSVPGYKQGRWLAMPADSPFHKPWWFRTTFRLPECFKGKHVALHLDGINYRANVWFNGKRVLDSNAATGMFRRYEVALAEGMARADAVNCLAVEVIAPGQIEDKAYRTKQLEATTGWDDHNPQPPDLNMGIWRDVYLTASGPVTLRNPYVKTDLELPAMDAARLTISVELNNLENRNVSVEVKGIIEGIAVSKTVQLAPLAKRELVVFSPADFAQLSVARPRVWWPNTVGAQELYDLNLTVSVEGAVSDTARTRFGIRKITAEINDEGWRQYYVNGKKILIRGGAWMTSDMMLRLTPGRYDALIRYAKEAHLNMLRSEGFSIRETDEFYDLCDQYGVMVTQQIFGRNIPDEPLAIDNVRDMMLRIRNHPSLVHFLGHDETFPTETLDKAYKDMIAEYMPDRTYQPHSGAFDVKERLKTGGTRTGTRELWTYANPAHYYTHKNDGAWGFAQSGGIGGVIAPIESMRKMMPADALWPPWTDAWSLHTVIQGGHYFDAMADALNTRYGAPKSIEEFCMKGQAMNYESARGMYEAYARNKYSATGITAWKYDAAWPASPTWQLVDWYLQAGGAYYGAQKACEPLHVQYSYDDNSVCVVNSFYHPYRRLTVTAKVLDLDMSEKLVRTRTVKVGADGKTKAFTIRWPKGLTKTHFLSLKLTDRAGKEVSNNLYWLSTIPDVPGTEEEGHGETRYAIHPKSTADFTDLANLPKVKLEVSAKFEDKGAERVARVTVTNPSKGLAFQVHLALTKGAGGPEVTPAFWSENYVSLLPGESRTIQGAVYVRDLDGAAPAVKVDGWNVEG
ncbi:MAG: hypothetical protein HZB26_13805 [Candidatus Hydrogenedentes bacterium]|nr:hypothetical protein [Candidatus Hydrogenedentota bacterium]